MAEGGAQTLRQGRDAYFVAAGLPADGGYEDDWVKIELRGIPVFAFPNTAARRRAVPFHDLHHVLTGYRTDFSGEAEIGAWELASGCSGAALQLNLRVFGLLVPFRPRRLFRAFVRGRHSRNLYDAARCDDALLNRPIDEVRGELGLPDGPAVPTAGDRRAYAGWAIAAIALVWGPLPLIVAGVWWLLR